MSHLDEGTLHSLLDGELEPAEEARLQEHLASCASCRGRLDAERATRTRAHEIMRFADPPGIVIPDFSEVRARRALNAPARAPSGSRMRPLLLLWAASVVLALGVGWFAQSLLSGGGVGGADSVQVAIESEAEPAAAEPVGGGARVGAETTGATAGEPEIVTETVGAAADAGGSRAAASVAADAPGQDSGVVDPPMLAARALPADRADAVAETITIVEGEAPPAGGKVALSRGRAMGYAPAETATAPAQTAPPAIASAPSLQEDRTPVWESAWLLSDSVAAQRELGTAPMILPDLPVVSYAVTANRSGTVRVLQRLPGGESLEIYQWRLEDGTDFVQVLVRASLPADSLERLWERLSPLTRSPVHLHPPPPASSPARTPARPR